MSAAPANPRMTAPSGKPAAAGPSRPLRRRTRWLHSTSTIFTLALVLRLVTVAFLFHHQLEPARDYFTFGWETGRVAASVAAGGGFSDPLFGHTGPTAMLPPTYVYLLAAVFEVFGTYSAASAIIILSMNAVFSALTVFPVVWIARRCFGYATSVWAGWLWAAFPYAIYFAAARVWGDCLVTLLFALAVRQGMKVEESAAVRNWILYALLWGSIALTSPAVLAALPFLGLWHCWRLHRAHRSWFPQAVLAGAIFFALLAPWTLRNYRVFGSFIPLRDNFWIEMHVGNTGDGNDIVPDWAHPSTSDGEMAEYRRMGELPYAAAKRRQAIEFISAHPAGFLLFTARRILYVWTGYWSFSEAYRRLEPESLYNFFFLTTYSSLAFLGLALAWRSHRSVIMPLLLALAALPAVHYVTHPTVDYRHPVDPVAVVLCAYLVHRLASRFGIQLSPAESG